MTDTAPAPSRPDSLTVRPDGNDRLASLAALYDAYKDAADAANEQLKAVIDAIKHELTSRAVPDEKPPVTKYTLVHESLRAPLTLVYAVSNRLDTPKLKAVHPDIYAQFLKASGSWTLRR